MSNIWLHILDYCFLIIHTALLLFNMFGWIWKKTRTLNLITLLATAFSWFGLGIIYRFGYCISVDWHWDIKRQLGETALPASFTKYLIDNIFGADISPVLADQITLWGFIIALAMSVILNIKDWYQKNK